MSAVTTLQHTPATQRETLLAGAIQLAERGWLPDFVVRTGIRRFAAERLRQQAESNASIESVVSQLRNSRIAIEVQKANEQHYELPPQFFQKVLGPHLKYSGCFWPDEAASLDDAEAAMLQLTCDRAEIEDGMEILDLGCGWGSFTLWAAQRYPHSQIVAVSNSAPQGRFITERCAALGVPNVEVITADVNRLQQPQRFDRVVSVEMFEHMRNYGALLHRIAGWLKPNGRLFVHIFCHLEHAYLYETEGVSDWMARWFFTGGTMPSLDLFAHFQEDLVLGQSWFLEGTHYGKTSEAWLRNLDRCRDEIEPLFRRTYGTVEAARWLARWRMFFLACAEVFNYRDGQEWGIGHYLFCKP